MMSVLFDKTSIKGMELKNRLVRSATYEGMADANGFPTKQLFNLYERLAKGCVGLIVTGHSYISENGKTDNMLGINDDQYIQRYRELVDHVHANGAKIAMQINHCGRQTTKDMTGTQTIAPSAIRDKMLLDKPRAMTEKEIERAITSFGKGAKMEDVIKKSDADYISLCRALIVNPGFPEKIAGGSREPSKCIHCNLCVCNMYTSPLRCFHGNKEKLMQN